MTDEGKRKALDRLELDLERLKRDAIAAGLVVLVPPIDGVLEAIRRELWTLLQAGERLTAG
jgi:hypothetical protein